MTHVLVTGGAGYIGSHACKALKATGYIPIVYDNLSTGWADAVKFGPFERGDITDQARLDEVFARYRPAAVMHFAALSAVGEAMEDPQKYWHNNMTGSLCLVTAAVAHGCKKFIFSSTCAVYGDQDNVLVDEASPQRPKGAYGASKRAVEDILSNFGDSHGLDHVIFRYFNVAGADPDSEVGESQRTKTHLIPLLLDAIDGELNTLTIHGTDYDTPDGTCIRDYIHVTDLISAHMLGLKWLECETGSRIFNLGTGTGFSVREVIDCSRAVTNLPVPCCDGPRRPGDCARLVSGGARAQRELGWELRRSTLDTMIADAWNWHRFGGYVQ